MGSCQLIQIDKFDDTNRAEKEMLDFLQNLPEDYFVYRELRVSKAFDQQMRGCDEVRPDFVLLAPAVGLISIEVKDWNITDNQYFWQDQQKIRIVRPNGKEEQIDNPAEQARKYLYAFIKQVKEARARVRVTSLVAFPRISRVQFLNLLPDVKVLTNPNSRFMLDMERTLFKEDIDKFFQSPENLFSTVVQRDKQFTPADPADIRTLATFLLPDGFRIGDVTKRQLHKQQLRVLSIQQCEWIYNMDRDVNYLLDVAGSGKTNALVSKAIHLINKAKLGKTPRVLLTTYNINLERNIQRIYENKVSAEWRIKHPDALYIRCLPSLLEDIVLKGYNLSDISTYRQPGETSEAYEARLREDTETVLESDGAEFGLFDAVFVDEIQDFDDFYLFVLKYLCPSHTFFFVGDIGQKIYERSYNLQRLGFLLHDIKLPGAFIMYRTPRDIGKLATRFIMRDAGMRQEFEEQGYRLNFACASTLENAAELVATRQPEAEVVERINRLLATTYALEDVLIITSETRIAQIASALENAGIRHAIGEHPEGGRVTIVDFMNAKGLEREIVLVYGVEDLYHRGAVASPFTYAADITSEQLSRRKIYIALTRAIEQLILFYSDRSNRFILELLEINEKIQKERTTAHVG